MKVFNAVLVSCLFAVSCDSFGGKDDAKGAKAAAGPSVVKIASLGVEVETPSASVAQDLGDGEWTIDNWSVVIRKKRDSDAATADALKESTKGDRTPDFKSKSVNGGYLATYASRGDGSGFVVSLHKLPKAGDIVCRARNESAGSTEAAAAICKSLRESK